MNRKLADALQTLGFNQFALVDTDGKVTNTVSFEDQAKSLFSIFELAGYLSDESIQEAVNYLAADRPFLKDNAIVINDLKEACYKARSADGKFDITIFLDEFAKQDYFSIADIIELITFLQQTAFDRQQGVERDRLQAKDWMREYKQQFVAHATNLGVVTPLPPQAKQYCANFVMGAAAPRVKSRIAYRRSLDTDERLQLGDSWALSGKRELSKGLDDEDTMCAVAQHLGKPVNFVVKTAGQDSRDFLDGVTETHMVNYLLSQLHHGEHFNYLDSPVEKNHWRATTQQSATDIAPIIIAKINNGELKPDAEGLYRILLIAEQPYAGRMAKPVQRAFNDEIAKQQLSIKVVVEPCGPGLSPEICTDPEKIKGVNSELGAYIGERYKDAASILTKSGVKLRQADILMFATREAKYQQLIQAKSTSAVTDLFASGSSTSATASTTTVTPPAAAEKPRSP